MGNEYCGKLLVWLKWIGSSISKSKMKMKMKVNGEETYLLYLLWYLFTVVDIVIYHMAYYNILLVVDNSWSE
jgi:hypothetical protein